MFALMNKARKAQVSDAEFSWWDEPVDIVRLNVTGSHGSTETIINVNSADPDAASPDINYGTALNLVPGDTLVVEKATETQTWDNEIMKVEQVLSATQFIVKRAIVGAAGTIPDNAKLLRMGTGFPEGSAAPRSATRNPIKYTNLCQMFKKTYEVTGLAAVTEFRTGDPVENDKIRRMDDMSIDVEMAMLFGRKAEFTGANGKPERYTNGLRSQIPSSRVTIFSSALTPNSFIDAVFKAFDYTTPAGDQRIAFCGNEALNVLNKVVKAEASSRFDFGSRLTVYGMNLRTFEMPQGTLALRVHPLFNRHSQLAKSMVIVDFSALRWRFTKGRDMQFVDFESVGIKKDGQDIRQGMWFAEGGLEVAYGGLSQAWLGNLSAT